MPRTHLTEVIEQARGELRDRWENYRDEFGSRADEPHDVIHEIADSSVPVDTSDLLALANENNALATDEPELGPAFDGTSTPVNIIAANVYEAVQAALWEAWREIESGAPLERADGDADLRSNTLDKEVSAMTSTVTDSALTRAIIEDVISTAERAVTELEEHGCETWPIEEGISALERSLTAFEELDLQNDDD